VREREREPEREREREIIIDGEYKISPTSFAFSIF
jgi:hypothetical protein